MKNLFQWGVFGVLGFILVSTTGCATNKTTNRQFTAVQNQIGVLTDELVRMDQELQNIRSSINNFQNTSSGATVTVGKTVTSGGSGPVYRTPSGFELPAKSIQEALKNAGYYRGSVDGKIGSGTKTAVKSFQRDHSLTADGVVGRNTWDKLKVYMSGAVR